MVQNVSNRFGDVYGKFERCGNVRNEDTKVENASTVGLLGGSVNNEGMTQNFRVAAALANYEINQTVVFSVNHVSVADHNKFNVRYKVYLLQ